MGMIEFKTRVSYHQFLNAETTLIVLQINNIDGEVVNDKEIQIFNHETGEPIEFFKGDYIFFHHDFIMSTLTGNDSIILDEIEGQKVIKHLEENQVIEVK